MVKLTLVSANNASSNSGLDISLDLESIYADKREALQPLYQSEAKIFQSRREYQD